MLVQRWNEWKIRERKIERKESKSIIIKEIEIERLH